MYYDDYNKYSQKYGTAEDGYKFSGGSDKQAAALVKSIADKYLRTRPTYFYVLKDPSNPNSGFIKKQNGISYYMLDLELAPILLNKWIHLPDIRNMYVKYLGSDLFNVCFISPFFLYEKRASQYEYDMRMHYILHLPEDDQKIIIYDQDMPSSAIGPGQGYNVCYTYVHYFNNGFSQFYNDIISYKKEFPQKDLVSDMDAVYAATAIRAVDSFPLYPINVKPLYFDMAQDLLHEAISND